MVTEPAPDGYSAVIRQAVHDAVRAVLVAPSESQEGSDALRAVLDWVGREHGPDAVADVAFDLALDLAEAVEAIASVEQQDPVALLDGWFHEEPLPDVRD